MKTSGQIIVWKNGQICHKDSLLSADGVDCGICGVANAFNISSGIDINW